MHTSITPALQGGGAAGGEGGLVRWAYRVRKQGNKPMMKTLLRVATAAGFGLLATAALAQTATTSPTLDAIKAKGYVQCGVTGGVPGFSAPDANNNWTGLEVDYCRALAAAIFNNADAVRYTPLTSQERFTALSAGEVDVLSRTTTWTMSRDTQLGIKFVGTMFYDGQGFLVRKADNIASALDLGGAAICIESGTTTELNAADYFAANKLEFTAEELGEVSTNYNSTSQNIIIILFKNDVNQRGPDNVKACKVTRVVILSLM
jgi:ABC-type amino acid transport substrate-binding protein